MNNKIYSLSKGMKDISCSSENHKKNNLPVGTVLLLNGYDNPKSVIIKNMGIDEMFSSYGAKYLTIQLNDCIQHSVNAYELEFIADKKDDRIQTYITDEIMGSDALLELWEQSKSKKERMEQASKQEAIKSSIEEEEGKKLFEKYIPEDAKALIVAVCEIDDSDIITDYFATKYGEMVILGYSKHTRDLFSEMRKFANRIPETSHLGIGCGHFEPRVIMTSEDFQSNGVYYNKGSYSHWHGELEKDEKGQVVFKTKGEAQKYIDSKGKLMIINFGDKLVEFGWKIEEASLEHREKYSMGAGYYLKDGNRYSTSWKIEKQSYNIHGAEVYKSMARRCIFKAEAKK